MSSQSVQLAYTTISNAGIKQKQPLLILHGLFGLAKNWRSVTKALAKYHSPIACADLRNHGDSPHRDDASIFAMASDVQQLITKEFNNGPVHIMGHSLGGRVAMLAALQKPDLCSSLLIVDTAPKGSGGRPGWFRSIIELMLKLDLNNPPSAILSKTKSEYSKFLSAEVPEKSVREFLLSNLVESNDKPGTFCWRVNLPALLTHLDGFMQFNVADCDAVFNKPTVFIGGSESPYIKPEDPLIASIFPSASIHFVQGAGHWVHADKPKDFCKIVSEFLNQMPE